MRLERFFHWQILDRWVVGITLLSVIIIAILLGLGQHSAPKVREFNWQHQKVGADHLQMVLTFNRLMDPASVEAHWQIDPPLLGRFNWQGRRLVYTLTQPAPYGQLYQVNLPEAQDQQGRAMQAPFVGEFRTPDRQFLMIGVREETRGRLLLTNLETQSQTLLTPPDLKVIQFVPVADGETVYYFATADTVQNQDLYQLSLSSFESRLLLEHRSLQNLRLKVSPRTDLAIVERIDPSDLGQTQLWIKPAGKKAFRRLKLSTEVGGDFLITPDDTSVIMAQGQGLAILPLDPSVPAETFLAQYGQVLAIKRDGSAAAMIKFNTDFTSSLWIVSNTGVTREVLSTEGSILAGEFAPTGTTFYCLVSRANPTDLTESPELVALNWQTNTQIPIARANFPQELNFSVAPDGGSLLYSLLQPSDGVPDPKAPLSQIGQSIVDGQVWLLNLRDPHPGSEPLEMAGVNVAWIP
jgi:hypothetical protein